MRKNEIEAGECYVVMMQGVETSVLVLSKHYKRLPDGYVVPTRGWKVKSLVSGRVVLIKTAARFRRKCTEADLAGCRKRT